MNRINSLLRALVIALSLFSLNNPCGATSISPLDYGLREAKTGIERYWAIYNAHQAAKKSDAIVDYYGLKVIDIEIPNNAKPVPLTSKTFFRGVSFKVLNKCKEIFLFEMSQSERDLKIKKDDIDKGDFRAYRELRNGDYLLFLEDETPWVKQRKGYSYGHTRKDILLIRNGLAKNRPISPYNNLETKIKATFCPITTDQRIISGVRFYRQEGSTKKTYLFRFKSVYNVKISDIEIHTPTSSMIGDKAIQLLDCYRVRFSNLIIDGTYSAKSDYGYGINMNNVCEVSFDRLKGKADWGVFGNNNVNEITLNNCDINRFDVHCYGKNIYMKKCAFRDLYNQFSSIKGKVVFDKCVFYNCLPFLFEYSYNAYTSFDLMFKKCVIYASSKKNYLIDARSLVGDETDERSELKIQRFPNLYINGLTVYLDDKGSTFFSYKAPKKMLDWNHDTMPGQSKIKKLKFVSSK